MKKRLSESQREEIRQFLEKYSIDAIKEVASQLEAKPKGKPGAPSRSIWNAYSVYVAVKAAQNRGPGHKLHSVNRACEIVATRTAGLTAGEIRGMSSKSIRRLYGTAEKEMAKSDRVADFLETLAQMMMHRTGVQVTPAMFRPVRRSKES